MPDFLLTDPDGQRFKLTVPEGASEADAADVARTVAASRMKQAAAPGTRQEGAITETITGQRGIDLDPVHLPGTAPKDYLRELHQNPDILAKNVEQASGLDLGGVTARRGFASPRQIRSHLDDLMDLNRSRRATYDQALRDGRLTQEEHAGFIDALDHQLAQARVSMGLPAESSVSRISAAASPGVGQRPVNLRTLDELRRGGEQPMVARAVSPPAAPRSSSPLGYYGQEFYNEHIAPHFPDQAAFVQSYFNGGYNGRFDVGTTWDGKLEMKGPLVVEGKKFGDIERRIDADGKTAHHDYLQINNKERGGGFVKQMTANQVDLYRKMGIERVEMYANVDVGGYAWAKYGWLPDPREWQTTAWGLGARLRLLAPDLDKDTMAVVQAHLNDPDPHAIWDLSDIKTTWQHPDWDPKIDTVGKAMLSGNNWNGTLVLNDPQQMTRFDRYVSQGK